MSESKNNSGPTRPIKIEFNQMPLVPAFINGKGPLVFALDTGYLGLQISSATADELGLQKDQNDMVTLDRLAIGDMSFENFRIYACDNSKLWNLFSSRGLKVAGMIGAHFLKCFEVMIDYPASTITFEPLTKLLGNLPNARPGFSYVQSGYPNRYITVPVSLNDFGPYTFILDTGANQCVVSELLANKLHLQKSASQTALGAVDDVAGCACVIGSLKVAGKTVTDLPVSVMACNYLCENAGCRIDGLLGYNFLKDFCVVFCGPDMYLGLKGRS